jgi:hypothetical protein
MGTVTQGQVQNLSIWATNPVIWSLVTDEIPEQNNPILRITILFAKVEDDKGNVLQPSGQLEVVIQPTADSHRSNSRC